MSRKLMFAAVLGAVAAALVVVGVTTDSSGLVVGAILSLLVLLAVGSVVMWRSGPPGSLRERDVPADDAVAGSRVTGGGTKTRTGDRTSTTGAGPSDTYVGRVAGDPDASGESGAEARAFRQHGDRPRGHE